MDTHTFMIIYCLPACWFGVLGIGEGIGRWDAELSLYLSVCLCWGEGVCVSEWLWGVSLNKQVPKSAPITPIKLCSHHRLWDPGPREPVSLSERVNWRPGWHTLSTTRHTPTLSRTHKRTSIHTLEKTSTLTDFIQSNTLTSNCIVTPVNTTALFLNNITSFLRLPAWKVDIWSGFGLLHLK